MLAMQDYDGTSRNAAVRGGGVCEDACVAWEWLLAAILRSVS